MIRRIALILTAAAVLVPAALAGGGTSIKIKSDPVALKFNTSSLSAKAGAVTITMANISVLPHNIAIKGNGIDVKGAIILKGKTSTVSAKLKAGTYEFYCSVPGHEAAGMKGTLTVK